MAQVTVTASHMSYNDIAHEFGPLISLTRMLRAANQRLADISPANYVTAARQITRIANIESDIMSVMDNDALCVLDTLRIASPVMDCDTCPSRTRCSLYEVAL